MSALVGSAPPHRMVPGPRIVHLSLVVSAVLLVAAAFMVLSPARPATADLASAPPRGDLAALDAYVQGEMQRARIPGLAYAVVEDGRVVHVAAFGVAGPDGRPLTTATALNTASVGKGFTALAARQLVDAGFLDLGAPVRRYLPEFALADEAAARSITVGQLLDHTSGLSNVDGNRPRFFRTDATAAELVAEMAVVGPNRPVGEGYEYSNLNYLVLGQVIESVSGRSYQEYVQEHVFDRLGMTSTFFSEVAARAAGVDVAEGHRLVFGMPVGADVPLPAGAVAAGMHYTTVEDLARYAAALADGGRSGDVWATTADGSAPERQTTYSMTWKQERRADPTWGQGFSGAWLTYSAGIEVLPNARFAVVSLANANPSQAFPTTSTFDITFAAMRFYNGWSLPPTKPSPFPYYLAVAGVLLLAATFVVHRATRLFGRTAPHRHWWILSDLVLPAALFLLLPLPVTGLASPLEGWRRLIFSVPDLALGVLIPLAGLVVVGLLRLGRATSPGWRSREVSV